MFSEREPFLSGFLCGLFGLFWSQRYIGVSKQCGRSFGSLRRKLAICEETLCSQLFQICFLCLKCFQILPLDGSVQHLSHATVCRFHHWQHFFLVFLSKKRQLNQSWFVLGSMNTLKGNLSKNYFSSEGVHYSFVIERSEKSQLWLFYISVIILYPSWMMNLA